MDYVFISVAVFALAAVFTLTKAYQKHYTRSTGSLLFYPVIPAVISIFFFLCLTGFKPEFSPFTFLMAFFYSFCLTLYTVLGLIIVRLGRLSVYMFFLMLGGMMIPYVYGIAFLSETPTPANIAGAAVLIVSLFVPLLKIKGRGGVVPAKDSIQAATVQSAPKGKRRLFFALCACVFILNGGVSTISKIHQINESALSTNQFWLWIHTFNFALSGLAFGLFKLIGGLRKKHGGHAVRASGIGDAASGSVTPPKLNVKTGLLAFGLLAAIALLNGGGGILMMISAKNLPASVMFPIVTGGAILLTTLSGRIFYKEKINVSLAAGLALTLLGTILFLF